MNVDNVNYILQMIAQEEQEIYLSQQIEQFLQDQEEQQMLELQKQYEMMSYAADLENFSPFDTINS